MTNTFIPTLARNPLYCVWIKTEDRARPIACVWIDPELRSFQFPGAESATTSWAQVDERRSDLLHKAPPATRGSVSSHRTDMKRIVRLVMKPVTWVVIAFCFCLTPRRRMWKEGFPAR
jgi:hypothetical protein